MYTDEQIQATVRDLFASGAKPTVRAVRARLGGGDPGRVGRILREMALGQPNPSTKEMDKLYQRIEDLKKIVLVLQAQNEAMSNALASREHNYRMSGTKQLKAKFKAIEDYLSQDIMNTKRPDKFIFNDDTFYVPVRNVDGKAKRIDGATRREIYAMKADDLTQNQLEWRRRQNNERMKRKRERRDYTSGIPDELRKKRREQVCIDGLTNAEILHSKRADLTPAQLEWCRQYEREGRERTLLRKMHKKMIEEKNMSIQDATMVLKKLMAQ